MENTTLFKPGQSGNPKGRKKGSQNKITKQTKESFLAVMELLEKRMINGEDVINKLSPAKAAELYVNMLNYTKPKLSMVKNDNINENKDVKVTVRYVDYAKQDD